MLASEVLHLQADPSCANTRLPPSIVETYLYVRLGWWRSRGGMAERLWWSGGDMCGRVVVGLCDESSGKPMKSGDTALRATRSTPSPVVFLPIQYILIYLTIHAPRASTASFLVQLNPARISRGSRLTHAVSTTHFRFPSSASTQFLNITWKTTFLKSPSLHGPLRTVREPHAQMNQTQAGMLRRR